MFSTTALDAQVQTLRRRVHETESQLHALKAQLAAAEAAVLHSHQQRVGQNLEPEWQAEVMAALNGGHDVSVASSLDSATATVETTPVGYADDDDEAAVREERTGMGPEWAQQEYPLSKEEYKRFGRQLVMPEIGLRGQLRLRRAKVLVVGVGGLGCPAAAYLAGAGVGTIGLVDGDVVEVSNLHRQIAHSTDRVGKLKVDSAIEYLEGLNPNIKYVPHRAHLTPTEAIDLFTAYDVVLDCTDHPTSRYLISDTCVLTGRPLVSASALRTEGQLTVLNYPPRAPGAPQGGPCYRCVFPKPPPPESVISCGEGGILGPVVGVMGVMQALETIKLIASGISYDDSLPRSPRRIPSHLFSSHLSPNDNHSDDSSSDEDDEDDDDDDDEDEDNDAPPPSPSMLLFSAYTTPQFRNIRLRTRRKDCAVCSPISTIHASDLSSNTISYPLFCGTGPPSIPSPSLISNNSPLNTSSRLTPTAFATLVASSASTTILDVRPATEFALAALPTAINIPIETFAAKIKEHEAEMRMLGRGGVGGRGRGGGGGGGRGADVVVVCRRGNDSVVAAGIMRDVVGRDGGMAEGAEGKGEGEGRDGAVDKGTRGALRVWDLRGGLEAWGREVDPAWPEY